MILFLSATEDHSAGSEAIIGVLSFSVKMKTAGVLLCRKYQYVVGKK
jgi:hypothetical protein